MGHPGRGRQQLPASLEIAWQRWAEAQTELAVAFQQQYCDGADPPRLRLVQPLPPRRCWRGLLYRSLHAQTMLALAVLVHPGMMRPGA